MTQKLSQIVTIATGVYEKTSLNGDLLYLQAKHLDEQGRFLEDTVLSKDVVYEERLAKHLLQPGDVLLTAKGERNRAGMYDERMGQAIASSTFFVIRVRKSGLLPGYLQWYFNTGLVQKQLGGLARGTHIASISKQDLLDLDIMVPPVVVQEKILAVHRLWQQEKALAEALLQEKNMYYEAVLMEFSRGVVNG